MSEVTTHITEDELVNVLWECVDGAHRKPLGTPHCFIRDPSYVPRFVDMPLGVPWIGINDTFYWWNAKSGMTLGLPGGQRIPLWTKIILCPIHYRFAIAAGFKFDLEE